MQEHADIFSFCIPETLIGAGSVNEIGRIAKSLRLNKILIATDKGVVSAGLLEKVTAPLKNEKISYGVFDDCLPDAPFSVIEHCARVAKQEDFDAIIALGGGSVMDTVKAASVLATTDGDIYSCLGQYKVTWPGLPMMMIPTTAGTAAEWTWAAVVTDDSQDLKRSIYSNYLHPKAVFIDPVMTRDLPPGATAETGMDALIHGIEAYTTWRSNMVSDMFAEKTIKLVSANLRAAYSKGGQHMEARYNMAVAAAMGFCFIFSGLGLAHAMAYPLQLKAKISHGVSCAILIPYVMAYNLPANYKHYAQIAEWMGETLEGLPPAERAAKSIEAVRQLAKDVDMPQRMRDVGVLEEDIPAFVDNVLEFQPHVVAANPRDASREAITGIFKAAW